MEIRNLRTFLVVVSLNSFTKAAETLGYSQSTVSFQIKQLEKELNCLLFERISHTLTLTKEGSELLDYAREVCSVTDRFLEERETEGEIEGKLRVATPDSLCEKLIAEHYSDFLKNYPKISLTFLTGDTATMLKMIDHNEADMILTLDARIYEKDYIIACEKKQRCHFVTGSRSPLAGKKGLHFEDLLKETFVFTEKGMGYRAVLEKELAKRSVEIAPALEISRTDVILGLLKNTDLISFLPEFITRDSVKEGSVSILDVKEADLDIWEQLIYSRNKWQSRAFRCFRDYLIKKEFTEI